MKVHGMSKTWSVLTESQITEHGRERGGKQCAWEFLGQCLTVVILHGLSKALTNPFIDSENIFEAIHNRPATCGIFSLQLNEFVKMTSTAFIVVTVSGL